MGGYKYRMALRMTAATLIAAPLFLAGQAEAQNGPADAEQANEADIIVSARKRDETLIDIPVAISAFDSKRLENIGAQSLTDVARFSPGLYFAEQGLLRPGRADTAVRFRGMSVNTGNPQEQLASVFVDGVYVSSGVQSLGFEDVERVEVIKGPQSSQFGRSTFGGAVNFVTRKPGNDFHANVDSQVASYGGFQLAGSVEAPIARDLLSVRVFGRIMHKDGQYENPAVPGERLGRQNTRAIGGTVRLFPGNFEAIGRIYYGHDRDGAPAAWGAGIPEYNCGPFGTGTRRTICGNIPGVDRARIGQNTDNRGTIDRFLVTNVGNAKYLLSPLTEYGLDRKMLRASLSLGLTIPDANIAIRSITAINREDKRMLVDGDLTPDRAYTQHYAATFRDWSQEVRIQSDAERRFNWSIGGNWFKQKYSEQVTGIFDAAVNPTNYRPTCTIAPASCNPANRINASPLGDLFLGAQNYFAGRIETSAIFGSADYTLIDSLTLSAEVRHQWDTVDAGKTTLGTELRNTFRSATYRGILRYKPSEDLTFYGSVSRGNLPGAYNAGVIDAVASSKPLLAAVNAPGAIPEQTLMNYEVGIKGRLMDSLTFSLAAYMIDWRNQRIRRTLFDPAIARTITYFDTAGRSKLRGLEFEGSWAAAPWLTFDATANYAFGEYREFVSQLVERVYGNGNAAGRKLPSFPTTSATFSTTVGDSWGEGKRWFVRGDVTYRGRIYADEINLTKVPSDTRFNLRGGVEMGPITAEVFVTNLFNSKVYSFAAQQADLGIYKYTLDLTQLGYVVSLPEKRVVGINLRGRF